tara:strand:+ start:201 stop:317 length:117 start_codon:yes stop_codon:yes gene_type:complete
MGAPYLFWQVAGFYFRAEKPTARQMEQTDSVAEENITS